MFELQNSGENRRKLSEIFFENLPRPYKYLIWVKKKFKNISCLCTFNIWWGGRLCETMVCKRIQYLHSPCNLSTDSLSTPTLPPSPPKAVRRARICKPFKEPWKGIVSHGRIDYSELTPYIKVCEYGLNYLERHSDNRPHLFQWSNYVFYLPKVISTCQGGF